MRCVLRITILLFLYLIFSETVCGDEKTQSKAGQPLPEDSLLHIKTSLEQLVQGNTRKANRALRMIKPDGAGSLPEILINLINAYSEFERRLNSQYISFLDKALWHSKQGKAAAIHYQQVLALIREFLENLTANQPAPLVRSLNCNLRLLSDDRATDGEPIISFVDGMQRPERIFSPAGPFTDAARQARVKGMIISRISIDSEGCVVSAKILRGLPYGMNESMINAFKWWSFEPARLDGQPVAVYDHVTTSYAMQ